MSTTPLKHDKTLTAGRIRKLCKTWTGTPQPMPNNRMSTHGFKRSKNVHSHRPIHSSWWEYQSPRGHDQNAGACSTRIEVTNHQHMLHGTSFPRFQLSRSGPPTPSNSRFEFEITAEFERMFVIIKTTQQDSFLKLFFFFFLELRN
jgi:hypothetical protein